MRAPLGGHRGGLGMRGRWIRAVCGIWAAPPRVFPWKKGAGGLTPADNAPGGPHISLTLAGNRRIPLDEAEQYKRSNAQEIWSVVKPVYEKMAEIVARHIEGQGIADLWLAGGSCMQPGVEALFRQRFPELQVHLPQHSLFMTPLAIANSGRAKAEGLYAS